MSLEIEKPKSSTDLAELSKNEHEAIEGLFDVQDYQPGTVIARSEGVSILTQGEIKVKVRSDVGESTIQILKPGDMLETGCLPGLHTYDKGDVSQNETTLYAVGVTKVLSVEHVAFENMSKLQTENMHYVLQGMVHSVHDILQSMKHQIVELRNYIYRVNGLY